MTVLICEDRSIGREFADWEGGVGSRHWALSEIWHGAVPTRVTEKLLHTHLEADRWSCGLEICE
jgi:hypothetical protein